MKGGIKMCEGFQDEIYFILEGLVDEIDEIDHHLIQYISDEIECSYGGIITEDNVRELFYDYKTFS